LEGKKLIYWNLAINKRIRMATELDSVSILEVYAPFIRNSIITFECKLPTAQEFKKRIIDITQKYPWLVYEVNGDIVGYAYASQYNNRSAYDWSADCSIYIKPDFHRKGIATALYFALIQLLKLQGYYNAYAGITLPNAKSEGFHKSFGFKPVGVYHNVGYKLNGWHDVMWMEYTIVEHSKQPLKPKMIIEIENSIEFNKIMANALQMIKN
jgi:L-amino acid N-acyltransferase YncA